MLSFNTQKWTFRQLSGNSGRSSDCMSWWATLGVLSVSWGYSSVVFCLRRKYEMLCAQSAFGANFQNPCVQFHQNSAVLPAVRVRSSVSDDLAMPDVHEPVTECCYILRRYCSRALGHDAQKNTNGHVHVSMKSAAPLAGTPKGDSRDTAKRCCSVLSRCWVRRR